MVDHTTCLLRGSSPVVGSSRTSSCGWVDDARRQVDAASLPAGDGLHELVAELADVESVDQPVGHPHGLAPAEASQPRDQDEVLVGGEVGFERGELAGQRYHAANRVCVTSHVVAAHDGGAAGRL